MPRFALLLLLLFAAAPAWAQTEALHVDDAEGDSLLVLDTDGGLLLTGTTGVGSVPATGAGTRLVWYPGKAAFRAGYVNGNRWDAANVGLHSVAFGYDALASGTASSAFGASSRATGTNAFAGGGAEAAGIGAVALGQGVAATGDGAVALGEAAYATGRTSVAVGAGAFTDGKAGSFAFSDDYSAKQTGSRIFLTPSQDYEFNARFQNGYRLFTSEDPGAPDAKGVFIADTLRATMPIRSEAGFVFPDGSVQTAAASGVGIEENANGALDLSDDDGLVSEGLADQGSIPAEGSGTRMMWYPGKAAFRAGRISSGKDYWDDANIGTFSTAFGSDTQASGYTSTALGYRTQASGLYSFAAGYESRATNNFTFASGYSMQATGVGAVALGYRSYADGQYAVAIGQRASACSDPSAQTGAQYTCEGTQHTGAIVLSDASTSTVFAATADNQFSVRAEGGVRLVTDCTGGGTGEPCTPVAGLEMYAGGSSWNVVSDATKKTDVAALDGEALLGRIARLPVSMWRYEAEAERDGQAVRHVGPMAQDWQRLVAGPLGLNRDATVINQGDFDGVNLAAVQALEARTAQQAQRIEALEAENAALKTRLAELEALEQRLTRLEVALTTPTEDAETARADD